MYVQETELQSEAQTKYPDSSGETRPHPAALGMYYSVNEINLINRLVNYLPTYVPSFYLFKYLEKQTN